MCFQWKLEQLSRMLRRSQCCIMQPTQESLWLSRPPRKFHLLKWADESSSGNFILSKEAGSLNDTPHLPFKNSLWMSVIESTSMIKLCILYNFTYCKASSATYRIIFLLGFINTFPLKADPSFSTWSPFNSREFFGQTHHLTLANNRTPQTRAYIHSRTHCVFRSKCQFALTNGIICLSWKLFRAQDLFSWLIQ